MDASDLIAVAVPCVAGLVVGVAFTPLAGIAILVAVGGLVWHVLQDPR